jgi:hypothetical protein
VNGAHDADAEKPGVATLVSDAQHTAGRNQRVVLETGMRHGFFEPTASSTVRSPDISTR